MLRPGKVYRHKKNKGLYLLDRFERFHRNGETMVAYIPLYVDPAWDLTEPRVSIRSVEDFEYSFELLPGQER